MSLCAVSRRLSLSVGHTRSRLLSCNSILNHHILNTRHLSCLPNQIIHNNSATHSNPFAFRMFSTDSNGNNDSNKPPDNNVDNADNAESTEDIKNNVNMSAISMSNTRIYNEAKNQKSLVKASGKNKSLVPYIGSVLVVPVQKPLFPGFSSMLYLKDEHLKTHFIKQFRKRLQAQYNKKDNKMSNAKDILNNTEWIGLFLNNPKSSPITAEEELNDNKTGGETQKTHPNEVTVEEMVNEEIKHEQQQETQQSQNDEATKDTASCLRERRETEESKIVWHPALDEVNSDMHHFVESLPKDLDDIFEYGVLAKIDYNDETTNIAEFVKLENQAMATMDIPSEQQIDVPLPTENVNNKQQQNNNNNNNNNNNKKKRNKGMPFPVTRWEDPLVLKVISARRIKLDSISEHQPLMSANIQHLQPEIHIKKSDIMEATEGVEEEDNNNNYLDPEIINENKHIVNESESEMKCRSAFNVASDLLRRLYADDPDNRRDMLQLWSARHHIDIGFFCDFAASITNSTPRELQKLLQCVDYGDRLSLLCRLLKREEEMMKKRDEILNQVDALIKKEDESHYLKMILHTTQRRLMLNHREKNILYNGVGNSRYNGGIHQHQQQQQQQQQQHGHAHAQQHVVDGGSNGESESGEEKKDRYQRLAQKYKERVEGKEMCHEAKEVFDEGIEKLLNAKNKESLDVETTKQYLDWISSLPWNTYSIDNDNIKKARDILDTDHYGMKLVKERILEVIACNILRNELNLNEKYASNINNNTEDIDNNDINDSKILCLVGPPGVGKTSIGSSIARALNRKFFKFSLGGNDDSHLLKGFLRTYAGSQPGKIIYGLKQCATSNPLILIDEIDKMGARHSDPSHALLEILDPSQNHKFSDNYLDFAVDLSKILFICTANDESKINPILRDRLHVIPLNGYDENEKLQISKRYLIPAALKKCGLKKENISLNDDVIIELIKWYCRESGVRSLAQNIERICYKSALELAEAGITYKDINHIDNEEEEKKETTTTTTTKIERTIETADKDGNNNRGKKILETLSSFVKRIATDDNKTETDNTDNTDNMDDNNNNNNNNDECVDIGHNHEIPFVSIDCDNLKQYVGLRKYQNDRTYLDSKSTPYGVVTGLAYTTNGGCITYVETIKYKKTNSDGGNGGNIKSTGQLGKVMGESVEIAQCVARSLLSNKIDCNNRFFDDYNIHLHCPEGGISKDGPSAGITMVTALLSLALNERISPNVAMTGEVTLTGKILKIGGLKEKLLAAKRAKINTLLLPFDNFDDFYDDEYGVPKYLRDEFKDVHFIKHYDEVLQILFNQHLPISIDNDDNQYNNNHETKFQQIDFNHSPEMPKPL